MLWGYFGGFCYYLGLVFWLFIFVDLLIYREFVVDFGYLVYEEGRFC